jgi:hypothetical protein
VNFLQGVQRLHSESMRSTAAPATVATTNDRHKRLVNWYADAWRDLQTERDWEWMRRTLDVPLVIGQQAYTGADLGLTDFGRWRVEDEGYCPHLYLEGNINSRWPLQFMPLDVFRVQYVYRDNGLTMPICWTVDEDDRILVGPAPGANYRLVAQYHREPSELVDDTDEPDLPQRFGLVVMWKALIQVAISDAAQEVLSRATMKFNELHKQMQRDQSTLPYV